LSKWPVFLFARVSSTTAPTSDNCTTGCIFDVNSISFNDNYGLPLGVFSWDPKVTGIMFVLFV
jgi:hypothetical protein